MKTLTTALALALVTSLVGCAAPSSEENENGSDVETRATSEALTTCTPSISAAAITKQIVSVEEPVTLTVELVTISPKPYSMQVSTMTFPSGFMLQSLMTTSCSDTGSGSWKCRHEGHLLAAGAHSGTGAYSMTFASKADANSGCSNGASQRVDFSLQTESFDYYVVDGSGQNGIAIYGDSNYGGWGVQFDQPGAYSFTGNLQGLNDGLSSVRVDKGWKVTLFENANYTGRTMVLTADSPFVGWTFNDMASAMVVERL